MSEIGKITLGVSEGFGAMGIVSAIAWGLGYFGQPHILTRFMAIKSSKDIKPARRIAMVWVIVSLAMAVLVGILHRRIFNICSKQVRLQILHHLAF